MLRLGYFNLQYQFLASRLHRVSIDSLNAIIIHDRCSVVGEDGRDDQFDF